MLSFDVFLHVFLGPRSGWNVGLEKKVRRDVFLGGLCAECDTFPVDLLVQRCGIPPSYGNARFLGSGLFFCPGNRCRSGYFTTKCTLRFFCMQASLCCKQRGRSLP
jgi:hypothetical protein